MGSLIIQEASLGFFTQPSQGPKNSKRRQGDFWQYCIRYRQVCFWRDMLLIAKKEEQKRKPKECLTKKWVIGMLKMEGIQLQPRRYESCPASFGHLLLKLLLIPHPKDSRGSQEIS
nr:uncharacterized protein LOC123279932 [Equus asinus]